jgi:formylglycine-generating enzyme required for sulfatase activity
MENRFGENLLADLQVDVHINRAAPPRTTQERCTEQLALAEKALQSNPVDDSARFQRACAQADLGENEKANEDLSWLVKKYGVNWPWLYFYSAVIQARLGKAKEARADLAVLQELHRDFSRKAYLEAVVSAHLGDCAEGMKRLEAALDSNPEQARFLYQAACAYAVASGLCAGKDGDKAKRFADRAVDLLEKAVNRGFCSPELLDSDLDPLRGHAGFLRLLQTGKLDRSYIAVWHPRADLRSLKVYGLDPIEHVARCKKLASDGFRPASISAAEMRPGQPLVTASVWHRPVVPDQDKEQLAKRQVNAAVALLKMGRPEQLWPLLQHKADPRVRSWLIHRLNPLAVHAQVIVKRLEEEQEPSARRALLLCLGEFKREGLVSVERKKLIEKVVDWYRTDPDPGIHSSAGWLLQQWGQNATLQQIDKTLATGKVEGQRGWYLNSQGQTFAILRGADFMMGSPRTEAGREDSEQDRREPLHRRRIGRTFAIAMHEVTVEQFLRLLPNQHYSKQYAPTTNCPVNGIAWLDAAAYCNLVSQKEGLPEKEWCYEQSASGMRPARDYLKRKGYRLPTEAEWEYACRAGSTTSRYYGETEELLGKYAWCTKNSETCSRPVGILKPNDWGLFDMLGNNGEWTQDLRYDYYGAVFGRGETLSDDQEHSEPELQRILRGGSFSTAPFGVRSATRFNSPPMSRGHAIGFRLARTCESAK